MYVDFLLKLSSSSSAFYTRRRMSHVHNTNTTIYIQIKQVHSFFRSRSGWNLVEGNGSGVNRCVDRFCCKENDELNLINKEDCTTFLLLLLRLNNYANYLDCEVRDRRILHSCSLGYWIHPIFLILHRLPS